MRRENSLAKYDPMIWQWQVITNAPDIFLGGTNLACIMEARFNVATTEITVIFLSEERI